MNNKEPAILMMSGGPDSATLAYLARASKEKFGDCLHGVYLKSGHQSDRSEIEAANRILMNIGSTLEIIDISQTVAALGNKRILIHSQSSIMRFGNAIALSIVSAYAFQVNAGKILIGLHKDDAEESKEYTREFIDLIQSAGMVEDGKGVEIITPFLDKTKSEVFRLGAELGVDYKHTWSCIRAGEKHCGLCGACRARRRAFNIAGTQDLTSYEQEPPALDTANSH
jgi:7-cyano-7-deazaguanine synthase